MAAMLFGTRIKLNLELNTLHAILKKANLRLNNDVILSFNHQ